MEVSAPQLALELEAPAQVVLDHASALGGYQDQWGRWIFDLTEARERAKEILRRRLASRE